MRLEKVFPGILDSENHRSAEYAIRVGWFDSPHHSIANIKDRCKKAAEEMQMITANDKLEDGSPLMNADHLLFRSGTLTATYLLNFLEYQKHPIWEFYTKVGLLNDKVFDYLHEANLRSERVKGDEKAKLVEQTMKYTDSLFSQMEAMQRFHKYMVYMVYDFDEIKAELFGSEDVLAQTFSAKAMAQGSVEIEEDEDDFNDFRV